MKPIGVDINRVLFVRCNLAFRRLKNKSWYFTEELKVEFGLDLVRLIHNGGALGEDLGAFFWDDMR